MNASDDPRHAPRLGVPRTPWDRRSFLGAASAGVSLLPGTLAATAAASLDSAAAPARPPHRLVDVNVTLGQWPLRRLPLDEPIKLRARLRALGVVQAWAGSFEALLHKDLAAVNAHLARDCRRQGAGFFRPFGTVDPTRPDWQEELRRCAEDHRMPGVRLHPNYHGYRLDHPRFRALLHAASERRLLVQLALVMEDERMMHPLLRVEPVDTSPLPALVREIPGLRLIVINGLRTLRAKPLLDLVATDRVHVEIAMLEGLGGVANLLQQIPASRVLFGSHAPLFYPEAAQLKLQESELSPAARLGITHRNASELLASSSAPQP